MAVATFAVLELFAVSFKLCLQFSQLPLPLLLELF